MRSFRFSRPGSTATNERLIAAETFDALRRLPYRVAGMPEHDAAPATKEDIRQLMEMLGSSEDRTAKHIAESESRMKHYFDVAVENIRVELAGANSDEIESIKNRIKRVEDRVGLAPA